MTLLSLVIATRERASTLGSTIASALSQASNQFEVVVSDNVSLDETAEVAASFADQRIRYYRTPQRLSMCDNYEFALKRAMGQYVIFIGDDDAVLPGAIDKLIQVIAETDGQQIFTWPLTVYDWPTSERRARLAHFARSAPVLRFDLKRRALRTLSLGGWKYGNLPSPYHSAVPKNLLTAIEKETGRVFHSTQPDVFTAMAIPAFAKNAVRLNFNVTINGRSPKSNGLGFVDSRARSNIDRFIREYDSYRFHHSLYPKASPAAKMIPDAVLLAKDMFPQIYGDTKFSYSAMWAYVSRLGFASQRFVLQNLSDIRSYHALSVIEFTAFSLLHGVGATRRRLLDFNERRRHPVDVPDNIFDFVRLCSDEDLM